MILTYEVCLNYTREDLITIGFSSEQINSVVYGETKFVIKIQSIGQGVKQC